MVLAYIRFMKIFTTLSFLSLSLPLWAQMELTKPEQTEVWEPEPRMVQAADTPGAAPADALVLFDGKNTDQWVQAGKGTPVQWKLENGALTVVGGTGDIQTKAAFTDFQLHIEWRSPQEPEDRKGQGRGNSGIFLQERYEVQILNSYQNRTYSNGQAASIYKQTPPMANPIRPTGEWNTYDIIYTAPRFRANGSMETPPYVTVLFNGIVVQNHTAIQGTTEYIGAPKIMAHGPGGIKLQDHGNAVSYRNIWIRQL